jgi:hypothetical protein
VRRRFSSYNILANSSTRRLARKSKTFLNLIPISEIPLHSLNHLREEFLQLLKHHPMSGHLRKIKSHRHSRLTSEGLIAPHKYFTIFSQDGKLKRLGCIKCP